MATIDGTWNITVQSPIGEQHSVLVLKTDGGAVSGTMSGSGQEGPIENATASGDSVSWNADITSPMPLTLEFSGKVDGDAMSGDVKLGMMGSAPFTGKRG